MKTKYLIGFLSRTLRVFASFASGYSNFKR